MLHPCYRGGGAKTVAFRRDGNLLRSLRKCAMMKQTRARPAVFEQQREKHVPVGSPGAAEKAPRKAQGTWNRLHRHQQHAPEPSGSGACRSLTHKLSRENDTLCLTNVGKRVIMHTQSNISAESSRIGWPRLEGEETLENLVWSECRRCKAKAESLRQKDRAGNRFRKRSFVCCRFSSELPAGLPAAFLFGQNRR